MDLNDYDSVFNIWKAQNGVGLNNIDDSKEGIERFLARNPNTCFVAEDSKSNICGVILAGHDGRRGYIYHMSVKKEYRRVGIGSKLLETTLNALKEEGIIKAALVVFSDSKIGNDFWESHGFNVRNDLNYRNKIINEHMKYLS